jgi:ATP-dependent helicase/nuclease subunit A
VSLSYQPAYFAQGQHVEPQVFYNLACDPFRSSSVVACAGAGKTWMLVRRMLRALLGSPLAGGPDSVGVLPSQILAITFTKKAAIQMRQRLLSDWHTLVNATPEEQLIFLKSCGVSPAQAPVLLSRLDFVSALIDQANEAHQWSILTFHGWFRRVLCAAPWEMLQSWGLPLDWQLLEDEAPLIEAAWPSFWATLSQHPVEQADYHALIREQGLSGTQDLLARALSRRSEFLEADATQDLTQLVPRGSRYFASTLQAWQAYPTSPESQPEIDLSAVLNAPKVRESLEAAAHHLSQSPQARFHTLGEQLGQALSGAGSGSTSSTYTFDAVWPTLFTQANTPRQFNQKLPGLADIRQAQAKLQTVRAMQIQDRAHHHHARCVRLMRFLVPCFNQVKRAQGYVDMNDLEHFTLRLLRDPIHGPPLQERLGFQVAHVLVDEFQDTNPIQWQCLKTWLDNYAGSGGGTVPQVFIVGDPKQSIYRFRRADSRVFTQAQGFISDTLGGLHLACHHTRRQAQTIVDSVNQTFGQAKHLGLFPAFSPHTTERAQTAGCVEKLPLVTRERSSRRATESATESAPPKNKAIPWRDSLTQAWIASEDSLRFLEYQAAAGWLAQEIEQGHLCPGEVMVLARRRSDLQLMQEALHAAHIPNELTDGPQLAEVPVIQDVLALLDVLLSPHHTLALAQVLKSPLFAYTDEALLAWRLAQNQASAVSPLSPLSPWLGLDDQATQCLARWHGYAADKPVYELLFLIYTESALLTRYAQALPPHEFAWSQACLQQLLQLAWEGAWATTTHESFPFQTVETQPQRAPADPEGLSLARFVRWISGQELGRAALSPEKGMERKESIEGAEGAETRDTHVRLLTIHKAKGLEAPCVLILNMAQTARPLDAQPVWVWNDPDAPPTVLFAYSGSEPAPSYAERFDDEQIAQRLEEMNLLYVAMTRAQDRLVFSASRWLSRGGDDSAMTTTQEAIPRCPWDWV